MPEAEQCPNVLLAHDGSSVSIADNTLVPSAATIKDIQFVPINAQDDASACSFSGDAMLRCPSLPVVMVSLTCETRGAQAYVRIDGELVNVETAADVIRAIANRARDRAERLPKSA